MFKIEKFEFMPPCIAYVMHKYDTPLWQMVAEIGS